MAATSQNPEKFNDYEGFVEKFKPKKTTDDCYTPPEVYEAVRTWVNNKITPLEGKTIIRPFFPGGDYENAVYPDGCIVIDNPPFSIISKICRFFNKRGIRYFLFAPALHLFATPLESETYIAAHAEITYKNGAIVQTSFRTNLLNGNPKIKVAGDLCEILKVFRPKKKQQATINHSPYMVSGATLGRLATRGITWDIAPEDCVHIRKYGKTERPIYGGGYLLSERAAAERAAAERAAAETIELTEKEKEIISGLSRG